MKIKNHRNKGFHSAFLCVAIFCCAVAALAQSGNTENKVPVQEIKPPADAELKDKLKKPDATYEFITPRNIYYFMFALKEAGKRGFKLDKLTALPGVGIEVDKQKLIGTVLTGTVKFDGEKRYDYNFFFAEGEKDAELTLNRLAKDGWAFREVITINNSGDNDDLTTDGVFANQLKKLPMLGNIYLLERPEGTKVERTYKLFKAGVGTGRSPSPKLQEMIDQSVAEGFVPVASYTSFSLTGFLKIEAFCGVLVEKREAAKKLEYKIVRGNSSEGMWEDLDAAAKQGFRIDSMTFGASIMTREPGKTAPVSYQRLISFAKNYSTDLAATLAKKTHFYAAVVYSYPRGPMSKNILVFEDDPAQVESELKLVMINPLLPKKFKKTPEEFYKTVDLPAVVFQKTLGEGFYPRDIYFSDSEGLMMVFAREKK